MSEEILIRKYDNDYSHDVYTKVHGHKYAVTYSEISANIFGEDIDFFYKKLEDGLTKDEYDLICDYLYAYKPRPLDASKFDITACYDLVAKSIKTLRKDWEHNCAERARGRHPEQTKISTSYLVKAIRTNMAWGLLGMTENDAISWMENIQKEVFKAFHRFPNYPLK